MSYRVVTTKGAVQTRVERFLPEDAIALGEANVAPGVSVEVVGPDGSKVSLSDFKAKHGVQGPQRR